MNSDRQRAVYDYLAALDIAYERHDHPPVATVEEAIPHWEGLRGGHAKNLFLRDPKGRRHFLIVMDHAKTLDIRALSERIGAGKLGFASERRLLHYLGLSPGSVSPFGLINDAENHVAVFVDTDLLEHDALNFHPNDNTATLTIATADFRRFLEAVGNRVTIVAL